MMKLSRSTCAVCALVLCLGFGLAAAEGRETSSPVRKLLQRWGGGGGGGGRWYDRGGGNYNSERQGVINQLAIDETSRNVAAAAEYSSDPYEVRAVTNQAVYTAQDAACYASGSVACLYNGYRGGYSRYYYGRRRILRGVTAA
eukprot:jgi/Chrzof1/8932/Cz03g29180.t1